jgi:hypothetical protein
MGALEIDHPYLSRIDCIGMVALKIDKCGDNYVSLDMMPVIGKILIRDAKVLTLSLFCEPPKVK